MKPPRRPSKTNRTANSAIIHRSHVREADGRYVTSVINKRNNRSDAEGTAASRLCEN